MKFEHPFNGTMSMNDFAEQCVKNIDAHFDSNEPQRTMRQVLKMAEEAGEFVGAYCRYAGHSRRDGSHNDVALELADIVIVAYICANILDIDLEYVVQRKGEKIVTRGWKEE